MALFDTYFDLVLAQANTIRTTQREAIEKAGALTAEAISKGGIIYMYDRGHLLNQELLHRAGGPAFMRKLHFDLPNFANVDSPAPKCRSEATDLSEFNQQFEDACIEAQFRQHCMKAGDVLFYVSVSGSGRMTIAVARIARKLGIKLVILTNKKSNDRIGAEDESLKLYKYADVHIDTSVPDGDACIEYEGVDEKIIPLSGLTAAFVGWAFVCVTVEKLHELGIRPTIYRSASSVGASEQLKNSYARYDELGY